MANYNTYGFGNGPDSSGENNITAILLLILVCGSLYYFYFSSPEAPPEPVAESEIDFEPEPVVEENETVEEEFVEADWGLYSDYGEYGEIGYPEYNDCNYTNYGYPTYLGTQKEGETCADAMPGEEDLECITNPPAKYEGTIDILNQESDPNLTCCITDGTCQWSP